ncbi:hypothetical protein pmac_cds_756 [Pandoravirus macleodensis]|uniref:Uncharacterized protein n=1 Tax=Pandoravirus macleodensis TaxID=2107707 RepID=A0A2U7UG49_9VIRU|nr:hypothetical protein pmac_cds_756 [Pandoravirus macleodensis]AVK77444.1 hypothetical protein pmac_cds_756 [Pandoravirus macleodensis]
MATTTTAIFKRPFDVDMSRRRRAKRPRTHSTIKRRLSIVDTLHASVIYDDDVRDAEATHRLVHAVLSPPDDTLADVLAKTSPAQTASALLYLLGNAAGFDRLCRHVGVCSFRETIPYARVLCDAALAGHNDAIGALVSVPCLVDDISEALMVCMQRDGNNTRAVAAIIEACEMEPKVTVSAYQEIVRCALRDAVRLERLSVVAYLADVAETDDLERHLWACALNRDDPHALLFATLWRPLGLCAHAYIAALPPCPALDYLVAVAAVAGVPCSRSCSEQPYDARDTLTRRERHLRQ